MTQDRESQASPASPPCFLHELDPEQGGLPDEQTWIDVSRWRKAERTRLITARHILPVAARNGADTLLADRLDAALGPTAGLCISLYWPFRGEPDLRNWASRQRAGGATIALPVVVAKARPLVFRLWQDGAEMTRGVWNIPIPTDAAPEAVPDIVIAPVVGVDGSGFRLGYGGGFYDRTLAKLRAEGHPVRAIGVGYGFQRIPTIFPQPHDIAMDQVLLADL